jgi:4-amino-4-deoxy-L-arabinose transferase-like glycosyltransferase
VIRASPRELVAAFLISFLAVLGARWDALSLPFFWDEAGFYARYAYGFHEDGFRLTTRWGFVSWVHTPLYALLTAAAAKVAGWSLATVRAVGFLAGAAFLSGAYSLARLRLGRAPAAALTAALLAAPAVFSELGLANADLPAAAASVWALGALFRGRLRTAAACFAAGALTKLTAVALAPAFAWYLWKGEGGFRRTALFFAPTLVLLALWFAWLGSVREAPFTTELGSQGLWRLGPLFMVKRLAQRLIQLFVWDGRWVLTAAIAAVAWLAARRTGWRPRQASRESLAVALMTAIGILFLSVADSPHQRYLLMYLPGVFVLGALGLSRLADGAGKGPVRAARMLVASLLLLAGVGYTAWRLPPDRFSAFEYRSAYRDQVRLLQRVAAKLEAEGTVTAITAWPLTDILSRPYLGYVNYSFQVFDLAGGQPFAPRKDETALVLLDATGVSGPLIPPSVTEAVARIQAAGMVGARCEEDEEGIFRVQYCR